MARIDGAPDPNQLDLDLGGFPSAIRPMQAAQADAPFDSDEYLFEVKWDGLRALLFRMPDGSIRLQDRSLGDITTSLPEITRGASLIPPSTILDGELVATDPQGRPDPMLLQRRLQGGPGLRERIPVAYVAFDLLFIEGRSLMRQPLMRRRSRLARTLRGQQSIFVPEHMDREGVELFEACLERGLEGIVAKHMKSQYVPGQRSPFWLKIKAVKADDFVVVGFVPADSGSPLGALLVAYHDEGRLLPCGTVAGGFAADTAEELARRLRELETPICPLEPQPTMTAPVRWCLPDLVVSVRYSEWSSDGTIRFPIFNGIRSDIHPLECVRLRPRVVLEGRARPGSPAYDLTRFPF